MQTTTASSTEFRRGPLAVLLTGIFLIVLDFFVVNVALPSVQQDLDADATAAPVAWRRRSFPAAPRPRARLSR